MVTLTLRVLSRPEISRVSQIYRSLGLDYDERVLPSIGNEVLKATVAQFDGACCDIRDPCCFSVGCKQLDRERESRQPRPVVR